MKVYGHYSVNVLEVNDRIKRALNKAGVHHIDDLCGRSEDDLYKISGIGKTSIAAIKDALATVQRELLPS
jgi:DNA-directed RNA polymerase alpha subunit